MLGVVGGAFEGPRGHYPRTCSKKYILEGSTRMCSALPTDYKSAGTPLDQPL